ncbi:hypothetical protein DE146DRAFT_630364 [Phaeosphaeria sp. MPI-PUGE-AT-0046c]|nr:hypothetical protein DE146DRAFT_630364 [Phaeosphaeria sp. MPI-PUGE-AT-0046c]
MLFSSSNLSSVLVTILFLSSGAAARNCQNSPGVANGECVKYYSGNHCEGKPVGSYKPDCSGNCFKYNFDSMNVAGDGTYDTRRAGYGELYSCFTPERRALIEICLLPSSPALHPLPAAKMDVRTINNISLTYLPRVVHIDGSIYPSLYGLRSCSNYLVTDTTNSSLMKMSPLSPLAVLLGLAVTNSRGGHTSPPEAVVVTSLPPLISEDTEVSLEKQNGPCTGKRTAICCTGVTNLLGVVSG